MTSIDFIKNDKVVELILIVVIGTSLLGLLFSAQKVKNMRDIKEIFLNKTSVVLSIQPESFCGPSFMTIVVKNDGHNASGPIKVTVSDPEETVSSTCVISNIDPLNIESCSIQRGVSLMKPGFYKITVSSEKSNASGKIYCP
jgi:hypothetical protein